MTPPVPAPVVRSAMETLPSRLDTMVDAMGLTEPGSASMARSGFLLGEAEAAAAAHEFSYSATLARIGTAWALLGHAQVAADEDARLGQLTVEVRALQSRLTAGPARIAG